MRLLLRTPACSLLLLVVTGGCATVPSTLQGDAFERKYSAYTYCELQVVHQENKADCGSACLQAVIRYWKIRPAPEAALKDHSPLSTSGYTLRELKAMAIDQGLKAYIIAMRDEPRATLTEQISRGRPIICAVQRPVSVGPARYIPIIGQALQAGVTRYGPKTNHFVVVIGVSERRVLLMDPAIGYSTMSWNNFERRWSEMQYATLLLAV